MTELRQQTLETVLDEQGVIRGLEDSGEHLRDECDLSKVDLGLRMYDVGLVPLVWHPLWFVPRPLAFPV